MTSGCFAVLLILAASAAPPVPRDKPDATIPKAISLLQKKQYKEFLKVYLAPNDLKEALKETTLDRLAESFGRAKAAALLKALMQVKDLKPIVDKDDRTATYRLKEKSEDLARDWVIFVKVDGRWYVQN